MQNIYTKKHNTINLKRNIKCVGFSFLIDKYITHVTLVSIPMQLTLKRNELVFEERNICIVNTEENCYSQIVNLYLSI